VSAGVSPQVCGKSKDLGAFFGEFAGALFDSFRGGSDRDFRALLREQTSGREAYTLRAARTSDKRHFSRKVHVFDFIDLDSTNCVRACGIRGDHVDVACIPRSAGL
jgi:hypothetical protein